MTRTAVCLCAIAVFMLAAMSPRFASSVEYPGKAPGPAAISIDAGRIEFTNQILSGSWGFSPQGLQGTTVRDKQSGLSWETTRELFRIVLADDTAYSSSSLKVVSEVPIQMIASQPSGPRLADHFAGSGFEVTMLSEDGRLRVVWRAVMLDEANYLRQELELRAPKATLTVREVVWLDETVAGAVSAGSVDGSLVVAGPFFLGCEDPMAENRVVAPAAEAGTKGGVARCRLARNTELRPGETLAQSFVIGVAPQDQLRRAFLYYLERERAHPYRPFLHYNSWYDIAWQPFALNEGNCLEAIKLLGERLIRRHGVVMDAMVFDDGWDNPHTLWQFHAGFPRGFTPLAELCREYNTRLGVWLSPFGGYGEPREQRLAFGREQGFETNTMGFSLAGPKYYEAFQRACVGMIRNYGVNHFKFDGIAQGTYAQGAGEHIRDTEAMRRLMRALRQEDNNLFINLTTGSWPSPFWLRFADSVWRQGGDMGLAGVGAKQQQWLTYRDQEIYRNIVCRAPLYPLNALMTQGVAYSRQGSAGEASFTSEGFRDDVRAFFGSGTGLQELYIQPGKLTDADWSVLAEAAKWSRANADVLVDTHWIGGDPSKLEVYGFASWSPRKGIVMLRNPDEQPHEFALDVGLAFELPSGSATAYALHSPWSEDTGKPAFSADAGTPVRLELKPFEVLVLDATPRDSGEEAGFIRLFPDDGVPKGWVVRQWNDLKAPADPGVEWKVIDGVLNGSEPRGTWLVSEAEYGDFVLKFEFKLGPRGNSGCALRAPMFGDPAFDGLELQMADYRYNPEAKDSELTGGIYRAIAPTRQIYKPTQWNAYEITLVGSQLKVLLNGEVIQDVNLDQYDQTVKRHDNTDAPPVKDRPRRGHVGFQELSRDGDHARIRHARIKVLDEARK
jgi:hypothetical protein